MEPGHRSPDNEELSSRRLPREDGSLGPPLRRPWRRWDILAKADITAAILTAVATLFTSFVMFRFEDGGPGQMPWLFSIIAPLMGVVFFIALIAQFVERERHGIARALLVGAAVVLAASGVAFTGRAGPGLVLLSYWVPALLAVGAATVLIQGHRRADGKAGPRR